MTVKCGGTQSLPELVLQTTTEGSVCSGQGPSAHQHMGPPRAREGACLQGSYFIYHVNQLYIAMLENERDKDGDEDTQAHMGEMETNRQTDTHTWGR